MFERGIEEVGWVSNAKMENLWMDLWVDLWVAIGWSEGLEWMWDR